MTKVTVQEFDLETTNGTHGPVVTIKQTGNISWDPTFGTYVQPVEFTPYEAEKFVEKLNALIKEARNQLAKNKISNV